MGEHTPEHLKACPFCGSGSVGHSAVRDGRLVFCRECGAGMTKYHGPDGNTLKKVIDAWNARADTAEAAERLLREAHTVLSVLPNTVTNKRGTAPVVTTRGVQRKISDFLKETQDG